MNARHGQTPIPLPTIVDDPRWIGRFSREVRKSIAALRDRRIVVSGGQRAVTPSHPWKVTCSEDDASIAPGFMFGVRAKATSGSANTSLWDFVWIPTAFAGDTLETLTGTRYIYAKMSLYDGFNTGGSNIVTHYTEKTNDYSEAESRVFQPYGSITVYDSAYAPSAEGTSGGEQWIVPIAKVVVTSGIAKVEDQYLTHNPTQQLGFYTQQTS
ncbi:MAG: hypothetical protein ACO3RV_09575 [Luteolibacter sp.]